MLNHYEILGVPKNATDDEIKKAYRTMSKKHHPDLNGDGSQALFAAVNLAYQILSNSGSRDDYDNALKSGNTDTGSSYEKDTSGSEQREERHTGGSEEFYKEDIQQTPVKWSSYGWHKKEYPEAKLKIVDPKPYLKKAIFADVMYGFVSFIFSFLVVLITVDRSILWLFPFLFVQFMILKLWISNKSRGISKKLNITNFVWLGLVVGWVINTIPSISAYSYSLTTPAVILAVASFATGYYSNRMSSARMRATPSMVVRFKVPRKDILGAFQWGEAGNLDDAIPKFGAENVHKGSTGEKYTEDLVQELGKIPGVRVMHGLKFPNSKNADVDHVLVSGNKVVFIDSKQWSPGDYWWGNSETIYQQHGNRKNKRTTNFPYAVEEYVRMLPERAEVYSVVLVHGVGVSIVGDQQEGRTVLANTTEGMDYLGSIADSGYNGTVDETIFNCLVNSIKS